MKVLLNASNLTKGGGIQVAASVISESCRNPNDIDWHYAVSDAVADEIAGLGIRLAEQHVFTESPARNRVQRRRLEALEAELQPDVVFTVFGPAYVRFKAPHLLGVAVGWVTHSTRLAYQTLPSLTQRLQTMLSSIYKGWWLRFADRWVVEAENARVGLGRRMRIPLAKIAVVPNTCSSLFAAADINAAEWPAAGAPVRLLYVSAHYPHKCLELIPPVAAALESRAAERDFRFVITLPESAAASIIEQAKQLGVAHRIDNIGPVRQHELVDLYRASEICFMPSVLETFSATYVEAMAAGRPVVASDLDFAHAVCGDSAVYFTATDAESAADAVMQLLQDKNLWHNCIVRARAQLARLPTAQQRYDSYVAAIKELHVAARKENRP